MVIQRLRTPALRSPTKAASTGLATVSMEPLKEAFDGRHKWEKWNLPHSYKWNDYKNNNVRQGCKESNIHKSLSCSCLLLCCTGQTQEKMPVHFHINRALLTVFWGQPMFISTQQFFIKIAARRGKQTQSLPHSDMHFVLLCKSKFALQERVSDPTHSNADAAPSQSQEGNSNRCIVPSSHPASWDRRHIWIRRTWKWCHALVVPTPRRAWRSCRDRSSPCLESTLTQHPLQLIGYGCFVLKACL